MADDDEDSLSYHISLPAIQTAGLGVQQGYGGGTANGQTIRDLAAAGPWREKVDPQTGNTFYYNDATLESRWDRPVDTTTTAAGFNGATASSVMGPAPQQGQQNDAVSLVNLVPALMRAKRRWRALVDSDTGSTYYVDEATGVSQWEKPPEEETMPSADASSKDSTSSTQHRKRENNSLVRAVPALMRAKRRWRALVDDGTGSTYYVDEETGSTQWEKPPEVDSGRSEEDEKMVDDPQREAPDTKPERAVSAELSGNEDETRVPSEAGSFRRGDDALMKLDTFEDGTKAKTSGAAAEVSTDKEVQRGGEPLLQRADSSSTLSTYGGELESLARYVTGHSTTLDRGTVVEPELPKNWGGEGRGGERTSDTGEDTVQSTDLSDDHDSTSDSGIESDEEKVPTHAKSSTHESVAERSASSFSGDGGTSSQDDFSPREQQLVQRGESEAEGSSSSSTQSISQHQVSAVVVDNSSQQVRASSLGGDAGMDDQEEALGEHHLFQVNDVHVNADKQSPAVPVESDSTDVGAGTASTAEGIDEKEPGQQEQQTSATITDPTSDLEGADGNGFKGASTKTPGVVEPFPIDVPTKASSALPDERHAGVPPAPLSGKSNEYNAVKPVEQDRGDGPLQQTVITVAATAVPKSPSPFDTAAVTAVALARLKAGMQSRRDKEASVKLQAQARGWAARRVCARLAQRRETRRREEREAKQRAATAIQAIVRGRAGRNKAQQAQHLRTELERQQAQLIISESTTQGNREESISQTEAESVDSELAVGSTNSHLRLGRNNHSDGHLALETGVPQETSVPLANGSSSRQGKEEHIARTRNDENGQGNHEHYDSAGPAAMRWLEGEASSGAAESGGPGHHEQYFGRGQDVNSLEMNDFGGTGSRFEPGPLGTIDEEGYQRNNHLWGGGEADETPHSTETYSETDIGTLAETRADAVFLPGPPELARRADSAPGSSQNTDDDFDEESAGDDFENDTDSNERRYDGSSRTSISSKTAGTSAGSTSSEMTASGSDGGRKLLSDGDNVSRTHDQSSAKSSEEERVEKRTQQTAERTTGNRIAGAVDGYQDGIAVLADNDDSGHPGEEFGGSDDSAENQRAGEGVYLDTTAPKDRLEDLRSLVAAQAQATARATMTAVGTDASKREAIQIRDLADRQAQAATRFREAVRRSIAVDTDNGKPSSSVASSTPSCMEPVPGIPPEKVEGEGMVCGQPAEEEVVEHGDEGSQIQDEEEQADTRRWNTRNDDDRNSKLTGDVKQTAVNCGTADYLVDAGVSTGGAAFILASDLSRLASRQGAAACELLQVSSPEAAPSAILLDPRKDPRKDPQVLNTLAALGQAVGLQAKAVGLMEEVVVRTVHSRLDARVAARAARKEQVGRLAESLAEDVKLVAARHQHAARRMEAAPDPATARYVADDIRRLTLVQEQLAYKVQQFVLSTSVALFNDSDNGREESAGTSAGDATQVDGATEEANRAEDAEAKIAGATDQETDTAQERLAKLASAVVRELRKGIDVGSIAAARAQAIRRGSQAGRLADELRLIASGQVSAALALAIAGEQLVADAMAEKPLPREYTLPSSARKRTRLATGDKSSGKSHGVRDALEDDGGKGPQKQAQEQGIPTNTAVGVDVHEGDPDDEREATLVTGTGVADGGVEPHGAENFRRVGSNLPSASSAVEVAASREEMTAATRIQSFLRRRRRQTRRPEDMRQLSVGSVSPSAVDPSCGDQSTDSTAEWFGVALRRLRREVDNFLQDDEQQEDPASTGASIASSLQDSGDRVQELEVESESVASRPSNAYDGGRTDDETADTPSSSESSSIDNDYDWPTFPPVPLRARAPSLYTLPAPESIAWNRKANEVDGGDSSGATHCSRPTGATGGEGGIFTKLGPEVVERLSSARSIFCLRAADVLAAFSPPPPPRSSPVGATSNDTPLGLRPSTVPEQAVGRGDIFDYRDDGRISSPDALRHRLRREAEDASRTGYGRPWLLSSRKRRAPTRHKREQEQLSAFMRESNGARGARGGGGMEQAREKRRRLDFFGSWTPLGRRLAKRHNAGLAARRRRVLGETDQFRARHVGRQLRSGAATNAVEGMERALDLRLCVQREKKVPPAHVTELLDVVDRYVFSDSQLCEQQGLATPKPLDEAETEDIGPRRSRCSICQELLKDLQQQYPVVRDQSSWEDDTNPFCCDRCWEGSPLPEPPEMELVAAPPVHDLYGEGSSSPWVSDDVAYSTRDASPPSLEEVRTGENPTLDTNGSRLDDNQRDPDGASRAMPSNAVEREDLSPASVLPTTLLESAEEVTRAMGSVRGAGGILQVRGDRARADLPPTKKADAVAAAFSAHLRSVDKYPLELSRLCRFAQFLTENELLREAYEVTLHILSYFAVVANSSDSNGMAGFSPSCAASMSFSPLRLPPGLNAQLLLVAGRLAVAIGRYTEAVRHVKAAVRAATHNSNIAARESPAILVSSSRVLEYILDDRSAEIILLGCILQYPDYKPALSSYGKLAARQGELGVAERYLMRAASLSCGGGTAAKASEWRTTGIGLGCGPANDWLALTEFYSESRTKSTRAADALACFRKALSSMEWRRLEYYQPAAEQLARPCLAITDASKTTVEPPSSSSQTSMEKADAGKPSVDTLLELGRFELLQNRSVKRALGFFKACLKESPWHASARVHLAVCMLEQLGPVKGDRPPSRAVLRIDSLLRSALNCHFEVQPETFRAKSKTRSPRAKSPPPPSSTSTPQPIQEIRAASLPRVASETNFPENATPTDHNTPSSPRGSPLDPGLAKESNSGRGAWLLWAFYAKFAERCLRDPKLAMYSLDKAVTAATTSCCGGVVGDRRRGGSNFNSGHGDGKIEGTPLNRGGRAPCLALVARAQFCQRWPKLFDDHACSAVGTSGGGAEEILMDATERYSNDPAGHAALGYLLLSNHNGSTRSSRSNNKSNKHDASDSAGLENLDRAIAAFRRALVVSLPDSSLFVPATRGIAAALRRRGLMIGYARGGAHRPLRGAGDAPNNNDGDGQQEGETTGEVENPRCLLLNALQESVGGRVSVALLRTAAFHLYTWRALENAGEGTSPTVAAASVARDKVADERQAEMLLARAVEVEPFHVPTMAALAFMLLQRSGSGGGRAMARAEGLLERAIDCAGRRVPSDILRTLAHIRAYRGRRSSAVSLFRRATAAAAAGDSTDDPRSLCGLAQLLLTPYCRPGPCPPRASSLPSAGRNEDGGQTSGSGGGMTAARPETDAIQSPPLTTSKKGVLLTGFSASAVEETLPLVFPTDEEKSEAARFLARAFSSVGGAMPPESVYFGSQVDDVVDIRKFGNDSSVERERAGEDLDQMVLADVHLAVSGFSLKEGRRGGGSGDSAKEWHLQEAARAAPPDTKTGITARYILGRKTLAAGDDRKAEILFLEALDAEPTTVGGCAALLSALGQVVIDVFQAKVRLRRLTRGLVKRHKGRRRGSGRPTQKEAAARLLQKIEVSKRSVLFLERLQEYASLRKRHAGDLLRGPALTNLDWALALEEGWEARYSRLFEAGDGWAAIHRLQQD